MAEQAQPTASVEKSGESQSVAEAPKAPVETKDDLKLGGRPLREAARLMFMRVPTRRAHLRAGTIKKVQLQPGIPGSLCFIPETEIIRIRKLLSENRPIRLPTRIGKMEYVDKTVPEKSATKSKEAKESDYNGLFFFSGRSGR